MNAAPDSPFNTATPTRLTLLLVAAAAIAPYLLLPPKPLIIDGPRAITRNETVLNAPLTRIFASDFWGVPGNADYGTRSYRPLVTLTYALQVRLLGVSPGQFHIVDMLLHAGIAVLAALLLMELLPGAGLWPALGAGLFAVHPVASEAVCSAVGRADLMAAAGLLGAVVLHLRAGRAKSPWVGEAGAIACLAGALLSKEYAVAFPFLLAAVDWSLLAAGRVAAGDRRRIRFVWGAALALLVGYLLLRWTVFGALGGVPMIGPSDHPLHGQPLTVRLATAVMHMAFPSLRLLVLPFGLSYFYGWGSLPIASGLFDPRTILSLALLGGLAVLALRELLMHRRDPVPAVAWAIFVLPLVPALNIVSLSGVLYAERFLYLPTLGFALLAAWGLSRLPAKPKVQRGVLLGVGLVLALFGGLTMARVNQWKSAESLARASLKWYGQAPNVWLELGLSLKAQGKLTEALDCLTRSIQLQDTRPQAHFFQGEILSQLGRHREAALAWRRTLALSPQDLGPIWLGLGDAELRAGNAEEAVRALARAGELMPQDQGVPLSLSRAELSLAQDRLASGRPDEAVALARQAIARAELPPEGLFLAGLVLHRSGEPEQAHPLFDRALKLDPDLLRKKHDVAVELTEAGRLAQAADLFREILVVAPDHVPTLFNLGRALLRASRPAEAVGYFEAGLELQQDPRAQAMLIEARRAAAQSAAAAAPRRPLRAP